MPREIDEDLIEATIRRVAESAAAAAKSPAPAEDDGSPAPDVLRDPAEASAEGAEAESDEGDDSKALERLRFDDHESFGTSGGPRRFSASSPGGLAPSPWAPVSPGADFTDENEVEELEDDAAEPGLAAEHDADAE